MTNSTKEIAMTEPTNEAPAPIEAKVDQQPQQPASAPISDDDTMGFSGRGFGAVGE
jgi:hypothetical protein